MKNFFLKERIINIPSTVAYGESACMPGTVQWGHNIVPEDMGFISAGVHGWEGRCDHGCA